MVLPKIWLNNVGKSWESSDPPRKELPMTTIRRFGPKTADHPSVGKECQACHSPLREGDFTTLITLGPGDDDEARERAREGRPYNAVAIEVHYACVTGMAE